MGLFDFDPDVLESVGTGLGDVASDPFVQALIGQLLQGGEEAPPQAAPGTGLQAAPAAPSPLSVAQGGPTGIGQFAGAGRDLSAIVGAPDLEAGVTQPTSADLGLQAAEAGAAAQAVEAADVEEAQAQQGRDLLMELSGLPPEVAAALTNSQLNTERRAREREARPKPEKAETGPQRRQRLEDEARVALSEAQAEGIQGARAVADVAGRLGARVEGFTSAEVRRAASKVVPQSMRKEPKAEEAEDTTGTDVVAGAVASLKNALEGGSISPEAIETVVRRNWPDNADEILAALQGG